MQSNVDNIERIFSQIDISNAGRLGLIDKVTKIFNKEMEEPGFIEELKTELPVEWSVSKGVQAYYNIFWKKSQRLMLQNH